MLYTRLFLYMLYARIFFCWIEHPVGHWSEYPTSTWHLISHLILTLGFQNWKFGILFLINSISPGSLWLILLADNLLFIKILFQKICWVFMKLEMYVRVVCSSLHVRPFRSCYAIWSVYIFHRTIENQATLLSPYGITIKVNSSTTLLILKQHVFQWHDLHQ